MSFHRRLLKEERASQQRSFCNDGKTVGKVELDEEGLIRDFTLVHAEGYDKRKSIRYAENRSLHWLHSVPLSGEIYE
jgi:hypothetical protein